MTHLLRVTVWLFCMGACALVEASADGARKTGRLEEGTWVGVKGRFESGAFVAKEVEARQGEDTSLKGTLDVWDVPSRIVQVGPLRLEVSKRASFRDIKGEDVSDERITAGSRVKMKLSLKDDGRVRVKRIQQLDGSGRPSLRGQVSEIIRKEKGQVRFRLAGWDVDIIATAKTKWTDLNSPLALLRPRVEEPERGYRLGRAGILAGELRADYGERNNQDLADILDGNRATVRLRTELGLFFPGSGRVSGALGVKVSREQAVTDEQHRFETEELFVLDENWLMLHGVLGRRGSAQIGRAHFEDERQWLYYGETDALRLFFDWPHLGLEAAIFEKLVDPEEHLQDLQGTLLRARYEPVRRHVIEAWILDFNDGFAEPGSTERRGFSPRYYGVSLAGSKKPYLRYWLDFALARGRMGPTGTRLKARAHDVGVTVVLPKRWEPSLTLGLAYGSGDDEPNAGVDRTFRQSGMHRNNGSWNGVTSLRYYGEFLRPELSNLHVTTVGLGLRPWIRTSVDLIHHRYKLDAPASDPPRTAIRGRRFDHQNRSLGEEWDIVIGIERWEHFEFELDLSYFRPGAALLGPRDSAHGLSVKLKYLLGGKG